MADGSREILMCAAEVYSIGNLNSLPTQTRDRLMSVPITGAEFHAYLHNCSPSAATRMESLSLQNKERDLFANTWNRSVRTGS